MWQHINQQWSLEPQLKEVLALYFEALELPKNSILVQEGQVCRYLYFLEKGSVRGFYLEDGKAVTHWFGFENDFITSFYSFITKRPAAETVQLMEAGILWSISYDRLQLLLQESPSIERLLRLIYEQYYIRLEEKFIQAHGRPATERYRDLLTRAPHILERVPLGYIASYLGISAETLSRIRSRL